MSRLDPIHSFDHVQFDRLANKFYSVDEPIGSEVKMEWVICYSTLKYRVLSNLPLQIYT